MECNVSHDGLGYDEVCMNQGQFWFPLHLINFLYMFCNRCEQKFFVKNVN